jgi:hypothetical protein
VGRFSGVISQHGISVQPIETPYGQIFEAVENAGIDRYCADVTCSALSKLNVSTDSPGTLMEPPLVRICVTAPPPAPAPAPIAAA